MPCIALIQQRLQHHPTAGALAWLNSGPSGPGWCKAGWAGQATPFSNFSTTPISMHLSLEPVTARPLLGSKANKLAWPVPTCLKTGTYPMQNASADVVNSAFWLMLPCLPAGEGGVIPLVSLFSGACAGAAGTIASYPFDLLRTTLAAQGEPKVGMHDSCLMDCTCP